MLEFLGNRVLREWLRLVNPGGSLCLAGFLAGMDRVDAFNPIPVEPELIDGKEELTTKGLRGA